MAKLLYITAHPFAGETTHAPNSFGLTAGDAFLHAYKENHPNDEVAELHLYKTTIPHIDLDVFNGWGKLQGGQAFDALSADEQAKVARLGELSDQFVAHDKYVFVTPMWNFLFPPLLKAYVDSIAVAGKTFKYTENGPVGLLNGKKILHIQASGGIYSQGPAEGFNFAPKYLQAIGTFFGITDFQTLFVEGQAAQPDKAESIKQEAVQKAAAMAQSF
ncbi:FMN-dependent NADH-azoreductase [Ectobacillus panaciterrae]|uniref:FMN-dependent NADH-azoreductase n=1 Tax=Ectobacillus panaciterrae TaxID=363872 RepID=UPI00041A0FE7|nr:FMN-dependent NADH-azoreductase [Ectobacillus panaciterrae]